jgi:hypothetical protein
MALLDVAVAVEALLPQPVSKSKLAIATKASNHAFPPRRATGGTSLWRKGENEETLKLAAIWASFASLNCPEHTQPVFRTDALLVWNLCRFLPPITQVAPP